MTRDDGLAVHVASRNHRVMDSASALSSVSQPTLAPDESARWSVLRTAIDLYRRSAFHEVDLDAIMQHTELPVSMVLFEFPSMDELLLATIEVWNQERMAPLLPIAARHGAVAFLRSIVAANVVDPALMRLLTASVNLAATPGHPLAPALRERWIRFHATVQRALAVDIDLAREPATMEPSRGAEQLIALYEGLQLQSMLRPHMDVLEAYDRGVTRLRAGWAHAYVAPVWEL